jgi:hypothetical protein
MNKHQTIEERMEQLGRVQRVDAPPFLYTRVLERVRQLKVEEVKTPWVWATALALLLLVLVNGALLTRAPESPGTEQLESVADAMSINPDNNLYF